ncbi:MAG: glycosyltransferase [Candidatus Coatesbacteria bacterium]|nr:MAG: glycosyltransferase [Candidatus Coatesbacteria bacterium]
MAAGGKTLRIAIYIGQLGRGGAEGQVALLARGLLDRGHDVRIATGGSAADAIPPELSNRVTHLPGRPRLARWQSLRKFLREFEPDVLHSQLSVANVFGTFAGAAERVPCRIMSLLSTDPLKSAPIKAAERLAAKFTHRVMVNSAGVLEVALGRLGVLEDKVVLIYNGVDTERFNPARKTKHEGAVRGALDIPEDVPVVGMVANLHAIKDHATLLAAISGIHSDVTAGEKAYMLLVGSGPEEEVIRDTAAESGLLPYVRFAGSVADVEQYYSAMDVFALTSRAEGFSNAVLEAMASGLPCVVTDVGGNREAVEDGVTGFVVPPGNAGAVREKLLALLKEGGLRAGMGAAGRRAAVEKFGVDRMVKETERMYRGVLE